MALNVWAGSCPLALPRGGGPCTLRLWCPGLTSPKLGASPSTHRVVLVHLCTHFLEEQEQGTRCPEGWALSSLGLRRWGPQWSAGDSDLGALDGTAPLPPYGLQSFDLDL